MSEKTVDYKYLFGPVPSRRLGISLGVDLMPYKTCSLDCVYCECGRTTNLVPDRREYVPTQDVIGELQSFLSTSPELDFVTFSGSGEPTLHSALGEIIRFLKKNYPQYSIAVLTNATLFSDAKVVEDVLPADMILPSLDAASEEVFRRINRPAENLTVEKVLDGLVSLRERFSGKMLLEIFIIPGLNDSESELKNLKTAVHRIKPDQVQLNSLDRPGTESWVKPMVRERLGEIAAFLEWDTEIIARFSPITGIRGYDFSTEQAILQTLKRRPCTLEDLSSSLGLVSAEIKKYLNGLMEQNKISTERLNRGIFYRVLNQEEKFYG
ncbi:radical SAM protein [candidate division KSB1 bacterium 4484_87]|nr:MAG: radical SAM protein [candidate division KSB1 bacterium 4484_87]